MAAVTQGCKLFWSTDSGSTYTQVTGVTQVVVPEISKERIECTDLDSPTKEYLAGLGDSSAATYPLNFSAIDTSHKAMLVLESSSATVKWKVELVETGLSTVTTAVYDGFVEKLSITGSTNSKQEGSLVVQPIAGNTYAHTVVAES